MNKPADIKHHTVPLWIGGKPVVPAGRAGDVFNPATGQVAKKVPLADARIVDAAVKAAAAALPAWRDTPPLRRARVMQKFLAADAGRTAGAGAPGQRGARQDAGRCRGLGAARHRGGRVRLRHAAPAEGRVHRERRHRRRQPHRCASRWACAPASRRSISRRWCRCGCSRSRSPAATRSCSSRRRRCPRRQLRMAELFKEAGLPDGVFNVVHGDKEAVDAMLDHPGIAAVSFVGSTPIAKYIYETCARNGKRVQALGGAKNHAVVLPDADLEFAADALIGAAYGSAGERCMAISAVVAVGDVGDPLVTSCWRTKARRSRSGRATAPAWTWGRWSPPRTATRSPGYIDRGVAEGAKLVVDGRKHKSAGRERLFPRHHAVRPASHRRWRSTRTRSSVRC